MKNEKEKCVRDCIKMNQDKASKKKLTKHINNLDSRDKKFTSKLATFQ